MWLVVAVACVSSDASELSCGVVLLLPQEEIKIAMRLAKYPPHGLNSSSPKPGARGGAMGGGKGGGDGGSGIKRFFTAEGCTGVGGLGAGAGPNVDDHCKGGERESKKKKIGSIALFFNKKT